ncbi:MAG: GNAT family N-acetyltransferase [Phyllobacteriaceae bacterium]|nr:GNAT family N-acetyltransferase [Phyllobacteriaceae bacterium]MBA89892.1 GNAT family N-acetyltransferase [Phyllobacteriaceae bacterium]
MDFIEDFIPHAEAIAALFEATFTASEGAGEGALIGDLVRRLMTGTPPDALRVVTAWDDGVLAGAILFTRLAFDDTRTVFMLSPVAVATDRQGEGIGQALITHGLDLLRGEGVDIAVTYGDPAFYGRVGFKPVTEATIPAPHKLQHPEGWLGQSLRDAPLTPLKGPSACVAGFDDPRLW